MNVATDGLLQGVPEQRLQDRLGRNGHTLRRLCVLTESNCGGQDKGAGHSRRNRPDRAGVWHGGILAKATLSPPLEEAIPLSHLFQECA